MRTHRLLLAFLLVAANASGAEHPAAPWRVGVAARKITPAGPMWLAGYANRTAPSDRVEQDVFAKALRIEDGQGGRLVIVTLDLIGVPKTLREHAERECARRFGLQPHELLINASHTHSGPQVLPDRMTLETNFSKKAAPDEVAAVGRYEVFLRDTVVELVGESLSSIFPARLEFAQARAGFAMNRRRPETGGQFSNNPNPEGPVDHDVPVLKVSDASGKVRAVLFGYACHNTTLGGRGISGDYAGYAQQYLQESFPGATALFLTGCGGDQNPYPRGNTVPGRPVEDLVKDHGRALANAVMTALTARLRPVTGAVRAAYGHAMLDYDPLSAQALEAYTGPAYTPPVIARAQALRRSLERGERPAPLPCPVQVIRFGRDLTLIAIGGEVVVDYSLRLKRELKGEAPVWVAGYSNDVFGYLGSRRVIEEGGYEGIGANVRILNHPGRFTLETEERVVGKVHELLQGLRR